MFQVLITHWVTLNTSNGAGASINSVVVSFATKDEANTAINRIALQSKLDSNIHQKAQPLYDPN